MAPRRPSPTAAQVKMSFDRAKFAADIETVLERHLPQESDIAPHLVEALRYMALGGGKRLRPAIVCGTCVALGGSMEAALDPAAAVEYLHTYSLIHDDLPAMDDDDLRRGRPSCHAAFDEATAILAGDAMQALAFQVIAGAESVPPSTRVRMIELLAAAVGWQGMVGGQAFDITATGADILPVEEITQMHAAKTGALFRASVQLGGLTAEPDIDAAKFQVLTAFGEDVGAAFQIVDDILDVTQSSETLGKNAGSDVEQEKNTVPAAVGLNRAQAMAMEAHERALSHLGSLGLSDGPLAELADAAVNRIS